VRLVCFLLIALLATAAPKPVRRCVIALYDSANEEDVRDTRIHRLLEMPLNHLGLIIEYHDINKRLPDLAQRNDVRGAVTWFQSDSMKRPVEFLHWAAGVLDSGRKLVVLGDLGAWRDPQGRRTPDAHINRVLAGMGLQNGNDWTAATYRSKIVQKSALLVEFERKYPAVLPPYALMRVIDGQAVSHLRLRRDNDPATDSDVVVTSRTGGYIAPRFAHYSSDRMDQLQWYVNPFEFFRIAFATDEFPKPDTTTLAGRRIYYSHIDGDGWRNRTEVPEYREKKLTSAEVILRSVLQTSSDLPVTVGPVAADLDPAWYGGRETQATARAAFALPWVEAGSHTYSHPLDWEYLRQQSEAGSFATTSRTAFERIARTFGLTDVIDRMFRGPAGDSNHARGHSKAATYNLFPFDPRREVTGAAEHIGTYCPPGKRVKVFQLSGSTVASARMLSLARQAGLHTINGGDSRFDPEFPSYAWVSGLSRQAGTERQIYTSSSNENTYTDLWMNRFFGFQYWPRTVRNTESPRRVTPVNLYYHMYSGEKLASLKALVDNLAWVRTLEIAPVSTSHYCGIAEGFFSATLTEAEPGVWSICSRGRLDTLRFDGAGVCVDYGRSRGVLGARVHQGSLYVALDPAVSDALVATRKAGCTTDTPYLIHSRWPVRDLQRMPAGFQFRASGFGQGQMMWRVRPNARWIVSLRGRNADEVLQAVSGADGTLFIAPRSRGLDEDILVEVKKAS
jgi:polysaccharide biosynthesis protein PelA